jgi:hypothetical protein
LITHDELNKLYNGELKDRLTGLEHLRKNVLLRQIQAIICFVASFPLIYPIALLCEKYGIDDGFVLVPIAPVVILGFVLLYFAYKKKVVYRARFKSEVVAEVIRAIDPTWRYEPNLCITPSEYRSSDLFRTSYDKYEGDDLISGKIDKTDFRCSELHTQYKTTHRDSNGHTKVQWHTIFRGLFFHADFNKEIKGSTYIEPDVAEKLFGKFGQSLQVSSKGKLVKLENPEFEKLFAVFSTSQDEARYILTPSIMEAIVNIRKYYNRKMYFSFIGSRVYCAVFFNNNLFEPKILSSGVKINDVETMFNLFKFNEKLIKELNLNTRIWTKQ